MAVEGLEALAANLLEDDNLVCLDGIVEYGSLYDCSFNVWSPYLHVAVIVDEKHLLELHISTFGIGKPLHKDLTSGLYLELLACNFYDCVHLKLCFKVSTASARLRGGTWLA